MGQNNKNQVHIPKRVIQVDGKMKEKEEKPEVIEALERLDISGLFDQFGANRLDARNYVREVTGASVFTAYEFVCQAYQTHGSIYNAGLPMRCAEGFFHGITEIIVEGDIRNSPYLRHLEILIGKREKVLLLTEGTFFRHKAFRVSRSKVLGGVWNFLYQVDSFGREYWNDTRDYIDDGSNNQYVMFVITDKHLYLIGASKDANGMDRYYDCSIGLDEIHAFSMVEREDKLRIYVESANFNPDIKIALKTGVGLEKRIPKVLFETMGFKKDEGGRLFNKSLKIFADELHDENKLSGTLWRDKDVAEKTGRGYSSVRRYKEAKTHLSEDEIAHLSARIISDMRGRKEFEALGSLCIDALLHKK